MAVLGTDYDFSRTGGDIVKGAFLEINAFDAEEDLPAADLLHGLDKLNYISKQWMGIPNRFMPGFKVWRRAIGEITLTATHEYKIMNSGGAHDIDPPTAILSLRRKDTDGNETPMTPMLREEYEAIGKKDQVSTPTKYLYELHLDAGYLWLNTVPSNTDDVLRMLYLELVKDVTSTGDLDYPQQYYRTLLYSLARDLCPGYAPEMLESMTGMAAEAVAMAQQFYPEDVNLFFQPGED